MRKPLKSSLCMRCFKTFLCAYILVVSFGTLPAELPNPKPDLFLFPPPKNTARRLAPSRHRRAASLCVVRRAKRNLGCLKWQRVPLVERRLNARLTREGGEKKKIFFF